jgi:chemosensory pili system protein ChpA (sensor histidine kinase/response regulator)
MVGPEEVVVRGLPKLLKNHPLFCGVILAGSGESVLLLDSDRVVEFCQRYQPATAGSEHPSTSGIVQKQAHTKRALVVDDSLTARKMLCKLLHEHGFTTVEAGDGIEAIEHLHRTHFDLVLTDLDMPRLGGLELLSDLHCGRYCDAPVVVVSSRDDEVFRVKAMDLGAIQYVTKPVSNKSITQLIEHLQSVPANTQGE